MCTEGMKTSASGVEPEFRQFRGGRRKKGPFSPRPQAAPSSLSALRINQGYDSNFWGAVSTFSSLVLSLFAPHDMRHATRCPVKTRLFRLPTAIKKHIVETAPSLALLLDRFSTIVLTVWDVLLLSGTGVWHHADSQRRTHRVLVKIVTGMKVWPMRGTVDANSEIRPGGPAATTRGAKDRCRTLPRSRSPRGLDRFSTKQAPCVTGRDGVIWRRRLV